MRYLALCVFFLGLCVILIETKHHKRVQSQHGKHSGNRHHHHLNHGSRSTRKSHKDMGYHNLHENMKRADINTDSECNCPVRHVCIYDTVTGRPRCARTNWKSEREKIFGHRKKMQNDSSHMEAPHNVHISVHAENPGQEHQNDQVKTKVNYKSVKTWKPQHQQTPKGIFRTSGIRVCTQHMLLEMRQRLTVWFRQMKTMNQHHHAHHKHHRHLSVKKELGSTRRGGCQCLDSVLREMRHLDRDNNHHLNQSELAEIEHNELEPCLVPFFTSCDHSNDGRLSYGEWCCCFSHVLPPCYKKLQELRSVLDTEQGIFVPRCDREGFYARQQCHGHSNNTRSCWCVDLNGNEIKHTRMHGRAHCGKLNAAAYTEVH